MARVTRSKGKVAKAAVGNGSRKTSAVTSSKKREKVWDLMLQPKTANLSTAEYAERVGLQPSAVAFAVKYFKQITTHLKSHGKMR